MHCDGQRNAVALFDGDATQVAVPGVAMHYVGVGVGAGPGEAARHGAEDRPQVLRRGHAARLRVAADVKSSVVDVLITEAAHLDVHQLCELAAEELDVHARATIDVGRVLVRQQQRLHPVAAITPRLSRSMPSRMRSGVAFEKLSRSPFLPPSPLG